MGVRHAYYPGKAWVPAMYWIRTGSILDILIWLLLCSLWFVGGWLLSNHAFGLQLRERLFAGISSGLLLFIVFSNLLAYILPLPAAYWGGAIAVLLLGFIAAWPISPGQLSIKGLSVNWPQILAFIALLSLFTLINRGMGILDDYFNLPLVSMMATGDVPPHFYLNPAQRLDYHYGLHLFAASTVRVGGFFTWSAFDLSKAFSLTLALMLAWLWFRRSFRDQVAPFWGVLLVLFGAGTRWLLLLVPESTLMELGTRIQLLGSALASGPDLFTILASPWKMEGSGPFPFPIAFANGIFPPLSFTMMRGSGVLPEMTLVLLLLLARRRWRPLPGLIYGLLIASLALSGEHLFVMVWAGILLAALIGAWVRRSFSRSLQWGWTLLPGVLLVPIMGGVLTQVARSAFTSSGSATTTESIGLPGMSLRWPPAFLSSHLGILSFDDYRQVLVALVEMGPVLLLAPWITWLIWKRIQSGKWTIAGLSIGALIGFFSALFIHFAARERDLSRLLGSALFIWMVLGFPYVWFAMRRGAHITRFLVGAAFAITVLSGMALFVSQMIAISRPQYSFFVGETDALMSRSHWNQLEADAWILDPAYPFRPPTLFGRSTGPAYQDVYRPLPEFAVLQAGLDPVQLANAGYDYLYIDRDTWREMPPEQKEALRKVCVKQSDEVKDAWGDFRRLLDIRACRKTP